MRHIVSGLVAGVCLLNAVAESRAGIVTYYDIDEFRAATGDLVEIDFSTLPDGTPAPDFELVDITPEFNYTSLGVTFSSPVPRLYIVGAGDHDLAATARESSIRNWIEAEFAPPVYSLGFTDAASPFGPFLSVYGAEGELLAESRSVSGFLGVVSDVPIVWGVIDRQTEGVAITSFLFAPVPEPASLLLLLAGAFAVARRRLPSRARRWRPGGSDSERHHTKHVVGGLVAGIFLLVTVAESRAGIVTYHDIDAFRAAAGDLVEIDFALLPDGSAPPLFTSVEITPEFNYTQMGVRFWSPSPSLTVFRSGNGSTLIAASKSGSHTWIEADFSPPVYAVGITMAGGNSLSVIGSGDELLAEALGAGFVGLVSNTPIDLAVIDHNDSGAAITSLLFRPVPEPASLLLLLAGAVAVARRR